MNRNSDTMDSDTTDSDTVDSGGTQRRSGRKWVYLTLTLSIIAAVSVAWLYVLFFYRPELLIDELADRTFPRQAEEICAAAQTELAELPFANEAETATDRADVVDRSNVILRTMVDELVPLVPESPASANEAVSEWLSDWRTYIGDREAYADNLRDDSRARFLETAKGDPNKGITRAITSFAQVNRMESCATPKDVA